MSQQVYDVEVIREKLCEKETRKALFSILQRNPETPKRVHDARFRNLLHMFLNRGMIREAAKLTVLKAKGDCGMLTLPMIKFNETGRRTRANG